MGMTYFKRYRMEFDLRGWYGGMIEIPPRYELLPYAPELVREHATAKYNSFRQELDANVFPCLARRDGCMRLMRDITTRRDFVAAATWLVRYRGTSPPGSTSPFEGTSQPEAVGTIQGLAIDGWGAIQNLGIDPAHRGKGLGSILLSKAAAGFRAAGVDRMHLEVTTENTGAIRLYERLGFKRTSVVYKAAEVAGADR
ncbi:MAG: GNAT family N-acetyltransferase [Planctomycetota bacterium]